MNFKDIMSKQGAEAQEKVKKQDEEKQKFEGMKAHYSAGAAFLEQERKAKDDLSKATPDQRDALKEHLASRGISVGIHYPIPIHLQPAYRDLGYRQGDFPVTEEYARGILSLPMYAELTPEIVARVAETACEFAANSQAHVMSPRPLQPVFAARQ